MFKITILVLLGVVLLVAIGCFAKKSKDQDSLSQKAHALVEGGATLLDVRTPEEFSQEHISGSINIPIDVLEKRLSEVPKNVEVVTYCRSGRRSARAVQILEKAGYKVFDLESVSNWKK